MILPDESLLIPITTQVEKYEIDKNYVTRIISKKNGDKVLNKISINLNNFPDYYEADELFDKAWLTSKESPIYVLKSNKTLNLVDLFSGLGGMTLGVVEAGKALGIEIKPKFAVDFDFDAINTYKLNFPSSYCTNTDICQIINGKIGSKITKKESELKKTIGKVDIVIGGPPCQGNSDLNNHTRRKDPKNNLLLRAVRFAEIFAPQHIIIENVQGIRHDKGGVTEIAKKHFTKFGYKIHEGLLMASKFGVAQNRRRYFLVATKSNTFDFSSIDQQYLKKERSFEWACNDLLDIKTSTIFDSSAEHSEVNKKRIEYLFKHKLYELPDSQRPDCHKNGNHSYKSVYGRMYLNKPTPTITGGFGSIGQGRFCHPLRKRSISPHEAARLQFIPDFFRFSPATKRVRYQKMIGNAVPSKLSFLLTLELLR